MSPNDKESDKDKALEKWRARRKARQAAANQQEDDFANLPDNDDDDDDTTPILTPAQKRRMEQEELERLREKRQKGNVNNEDDKAQEEQENVETKQVDTEQKPVSSHETTDPPSTADMDQALPDADTHNPPPVDPGRVQSLLEQAVALHESQKHLTAEERAARQRKHEEEMLLRHAQQVGGKALKNAKQVAHGIAYTEPMPSTWRVPRHILQQGEAVWHKMRQDWHIDVEGSNIPPPMARFVDMKLPSPVIQCLQEKGITRPTPIQMQGIPIALAGRDMVGIAFTGSGKTLTFCLPAVLAALEEELRMPIRPREGPTGAILAPSRELARQTYENVVDFCRAIAQQPEYPSLRALLLIGGESLRDQARIIEEAGVHVVVATPGRLRGMLKQRTLNFDICRFICLDEADRLMELGFDEEVGEIFNFFKKQKQTLLFSATFPQKFQDFARQTLVQPIVCNVGRAGAANLDVIQEVEYVKQDAKIVYLLHCLQKTAPPVCVFSQRQREVDEIHEYLLLKGVEAVSLHGGKSQEERNEAIQLFKDGQKDVLIATDVAAKGLDFPAIQVGCTDSVCR